MQSTTRKACLQTTLAVARELGWSPQRICFEITETASIDDPLQLQEIVDTYRHHGFSVAIDDFGSRDANLDMLVDLRPDIRKIDRALISGIEANESLQAIARMTSEMARSMGMIGLAEGVETVAEARWLYRANISCQQGGFYARQQTK